MAPLMDRDPWDWSIQDVTAFFIHRHARQAMDEMPGVNLPVAGELTTKLSYEGVTGAVLLLAVDAEFLRRRCKITSLGPRAAVLHCINKLQAISPKYQSRNKPTVWTAAIPQDEPLYLDEDKVAELIVKLLVPGGRLLQLLASQAGLSPQPTDAQVATGDPMQLDEAQPTSTTTPTVDTVEPTNPVDSARPNETLVESKDGKKRRRLDLSTTVKEAPLDTQTFDADDIGRNLPERKLPVDEMFFGNTAMGRELGPLQINHPLYVHEGSDQKEYNEKNFQYFNFDLHLGMAAHVGSQMQRFMYSYERKDITRHRKDAVAVFPYRHGLQAERTKEAPQYDRRGRIVLGGLRSAMVVQQRSPAEPSNDDSEENACIAVRENEALIERTNDYSPAQAAELSGDGEFDHLLLKYREDENDLMSEANPETDSAVTEEDEDTSTEFGDDQAEEDDEDVIAEEEVTEIVQSVIDGFIAHWQEVKRPKRELKDAWKTWKQMKRSRILRDTLIQGARTRIQELQARLLTMKSDVARDSWDVRTNLEKTCQGLQPTVEDIQAEFWKIDVWNRREEPDHVSRKTKQKQAVHGHAPAQQQKPEAMPRLPSEDRMSVLSHRRSPSPDFPHDDEARESEAEADRFHTPHGSPVLQADDSPFVVPDEDDAMDIEESTHATPGAMMEDDASQLSIPIRPASVDRARSVHGEAQDSPSKQNMFVALKTPTSAMQSRDATSTDMPSPSGHGLFKRPKASPTASVIDITDLPSSPFEPATPAKLKSSTQKKGKGRKRRTSEAEDAKGKMPSTSEADSWKYSDLINEDNREGILVKLLRDMGPAKRDALWRPFQSVPFKKYFTLVVTAMDALTTREDTPGNNATPSANNANVQSAKTCARLLIAFHLVRPDAYSERGSLPADIIATLDKSPITENDTKFFLAIMRNQVQRKMHAIFSSPIPPSYHDPIVIGDSDDEPFAHEDVDLDDSNLAVPGSTKKRRKVDQDVGALNQRKAARARMEESQQQQSSNDAVLEAMSTTKSNPGTKAINPLRKPDQEPIFIEKNIAQAMKPYQLEGVQFLWRELTGDLEGAQGCLLAHTMGLGKTMQSIALLRCVDMASQSSSINITNQLPEDLRLGNDRNKRSLRFLIICPSSLLQNWRRELEQWVDPTAFGGNMYSIVSAGDGSGYRQILQNWSKHGGVLLIGYPLFRSLVMRKDKEVAEKDQDDARKIAEVKMFNETSETVRHILTHDAELVVADEAHQVKNATSAVTVAASKFETKARIALTGTPMSNDVDEIYAIISWVSPGYLGDRTQFSHFFGLPIKDGLYADSTREQKRWSTIKLKSLHYQVEPKVHRAGISVLKGELKPKVEFVLTVELTEQQRVAYTATVAALLGSADLGTTALTQIFAWLGVLGLLTAHPRCFRQKLLTPKPAPASAATPAPRVPASRRSTVTNTTAGNDDDVSVVETEVTDSTEGSPEVPGDESVYALGFSEAVVNALVEGVSDDFSPLLSAKTRLLRKILDLSKKCGDKVLVFSTSIPTLNYLGELFKVDKVKFGRIDGKMAMVDRTKFLAKFQSEDGDLDVMLISTRAGGQGLNIQSANRVIIFDFGFNPAWEEQAIGRAYRFGQEKPVFVYRFVAGGTFESNIYNTQMFKTSLASRVVDKRNPHRNAIRNTKKYLYPPKDVVHRDLRKDLKTDLDPNVLSKILKAQIERGDDRDPSIDICEVQTMEVLQAEAEEDPLNEEEQKQVEQNKNHWKTTKDSGFRIGLPMVTDHTLLARATGAPSSTAPGPSVPAVPRTASMPSSKQACPRFGAPSAPGAAPSYIASPFTQPLNHGQRRTSTTGLPARDIRNGGGFGMGGLPMPRRDD